MLTLSLDLVLVSGSPVVGQRSGRSDVIPIIAGVLGAIVGLFLLGLVCFCFIHKKSRRDSELDCYKLFSDIVKQSTIDSKLSSPPLLVKRIVPISLRLTFSFRHQQIRRQESSLHSA